MLYDAFICHASEDKDNFVRPLAQALTSFHLHIWYDEFSLSVGDSLRRTIDEGLAKSLFGIVVLSPAFFEKGWAQRELDGLVARQIAEGRRLILPVWHNITAQQMVTYSPPLADSVAVQSSSGIDAVCRALLRKLRPDESPLITARDELLRHAIEPPVISDEWWLDVVEASNRIPNGGAYIPPETCWGAWSFPLPHQYSVGSQRGLHLAWTAMQMRWCAYAEEFKICQVTEPGRVHEFLAKFPGLSGMCLDYPEHLTFYAPQLTIPEFSGFLSDAFDAALNRSMSEQMAGRHKTTDGKPALCDEEWSLRHPEFGNYGPSAVASFFVQGEMFSPKVDFFNNFEYLVWMLSRHSSWLPVRHRTYLLQGMKDWAMWLSPSGEGYAAGNVFFETLSAARTRRAFKITPAILEGLRDAIDNALARLGLTDSSAKIAEAFMDEGGIVDGYFEALRKRTAKRGR